MARTGRRARFSRFRRCLMLTLSGLRILLKIRNNCGSLPEDWSEQAHKYLMNKRVIYKRFRRPWDYEQLKEAESIVRCLYG
jgi:hypothetical protein